MSSPAKVRISERKTKEKPIFLLFFRAEVLSNLLQSYYVCILKSYH